VPDGDEPTPLRHIPSELRTVVIDKLLVYSPWLFVAPKLKALNDLSLAVRWTGKAVATTLISNLVDHASRSHDSAARRIPFFQQALDLCRVGDARYLAQVCGAIVAPLKPEHSVLILKPQRETR
jgi:hypothetical protein